MGLRPASVRLTHVRNVVMAPALTESTQAQTFKLPARDHMQPVSPVNKIADTGTKFVLNGRSAYCDNKNSSGTESDAVATTTTPSPPQPPTAAIDPNPFVNDDGINNLITEQFLTSTENCSDIIMSDDQTFMSDAPTTDMGLSSKLSHFDASSGLHHSNGDGKNTANDVEQLFNNLTKEAAELTKELTTQNVDDLMQVIKSIEENAAVDNGLDDVENCARVNDVDGTDVGEEEVFPVAGLTNNLSFEKLLNDVDVMNMSIDETQDLDADSIKETKSKDLIVKLKAKQAKVEKRLELLRRKIRKLQTRHMGHHVSDELLGVFECIQRTYKRSKDDQMHQYSRPFMSTPPASSMQDDFLSDTVNMKPLTANEVKLMVKRLEMSASVQANASSKQKHLVKYFGSGSSELNPVQSVVPTVTQLSVEHKQELYKLAGTLNTQMKIIQHEVDSEATESSSGGESCDELQVYNNPHQQYLSIQKRALWKYLTARASIAARWTWLQTQISDLEYRIRQHSDLHRQIRATKGIVTLDGENPPCSFESPSASPSPITTTTVNGYRGQLPGSSLIPTSLQFDVLKDGGDCGDAMENDSHQISYQCARTRPLVNFKKRKLLQTAGLHVVSKKASRPSTVRCECVSPLVTCALCTGRTDPTYPRDPLEAFSKQERIALVDPAFHPVFSLPEDASFAVHCDSIMKVNEWQQKSMRLKTLKALKGDRAEKGLVDNRTKKFEHRKKYDRLLEKSSTTVNAPNKIKNKIRGRKLNHRHSSSNRIKRKRSSSKLSSSHHSLASSTVSSAIAGDDDEIESISNRVTQSANASPSSSPLLHMHSLSGYSRRLRASSYDIDNIVIPYSVAASTRVEKLQYKEILTPKWRLAPELDKPAETQNGAVKNASQDSDAEDLSTEAVLLRHDKCEHEEKKRFLSYMKFPLGYARSRSHKRTDSLAESSGANTPDPMSPYAAFESQPNHDSNHSISLTNTTSTPTSYTSPSVMATTDEGTTSITSTPIHNVQMLSNALRRRTISQTRHNAGKDGGFTHTTTPIAVPTPSCDTNHHHVSVDSDEMAPPFDSRSFPLEDDIYTKMLESMPDHQFKTNDRSQDCHNDQPEANLFYLDEKVDSPGTESTESAVGDEDPNDPEWLDVERSRDQRHKR